MGDLLASGHLLELLQIGSLGMTKVSSSVLEQFVPAFRVFGLPYLFRDDAHRFAVLEGPVGRQLLLAGEAVWLRGLTYYDAGTRSFYTTRRAIERPRDLSGLKIRTQESASAIRMINLLGGAATPISFGELYTALQQGIVDGAENNPPSYHTSRHYEVARFYSLDEHTAVPDVLLVSTVVWEERPAIFSAFSAKSALSSLISPLICRRCDVTPGSVPVLRWVPLPAARRPSIRNSQWRAQGEPSQGHRPACSHGCRDR